MCLGDNCQPGDQSFNEGDTHQGAMDKVWCSSFSNLQGCDNENRSWTNRAIKPNWRWWLWAVLGWPTASSMRLWQILGQRRVNPPQDGDLLSLRLIIFLNIDDHGDFVILMCIMIIVVFIWLSSDIQGPTAYLGHDFSGVSYINLTSGRCV